MQPFGATFGGLDGEGLERVRFEVFAACFVFFAALPDAGAGADDEHGHGIFWWIHVVRQTQAIGLALPAEMECMQNLCVLCAFARDKP